jgi:hypothetical protein
MTFFAIASVNETTGHLGSIRMLFHAHDARSNNARNRHADNIHFLDSKTKRVECECDSVRIVWQIRHLTKD